MPQIIPLLTFMLVRMWYEESTPRVHVNVVSQVIPMGKYPLVVGMMEKCQRVHPPCIISKEDISYLVKINDIPHCTCLKFKKTSSHALEGREDMCKLQTSLLLCD